MIKKIPILSISLLAALVTTAGIAQASTNDFVISSYTIDYNLSRDTDNRSVLKTKETIVAEFPQIDQNHGIERAIPKEYDGHPTSLDIKSVTDENGKKWDYSTSGKSKFDVLRIGDSDEYAHGTKTFVIEYAQRDVTKTFANTNSDEFYWDANGTDWRVPINNLSTTLQIDSSIESSLTGKTACYQGLRGSKQTCELTKDDATFFAAATDLKPGENVTLAIGFQPDTFGAYAQSTFEKALEIWLAVQAVILIVGIGLTIWLSVRYYRQSNRTNEHDPIAPEYLPPKDASVETSARLLRSSNSFAAQLIDLAVRHYLKIYQTKGKGFFSQAEYELEIVRSIDELRPEEKEILTDIFDGKTHVGSRLEMKKLKSDYKLQKRLRDNPKKLKELVRGKYALRQKGTDKSAWFTRFGKWTLIAAVLLLSPVLLIVSIIAFSLGYTLWPLTDKGLGLVRYLKGLKMYIEVAEKDRLKMLQSPEGAAKVGVDTREDAQLVKLYERVLSYAILFGQEQEWNKQLGRYYETTDMQPNWYVGAAGVGAFNAASFSSAISSFSSAAASSSSTGGSGGGGSSGGGGGGGGGGGW